MKIGISIVLIGVGILIGYLAHPINNSRKSTTPSFSDMGQPLGDVINCEFKVISDFVYMNEKDQSSEANRKVLYGATENNSQLVTFTGVSSNSPKVKGNMGEGPLTQLKNDKDSVVLAEQNDSGDVFIYTIFKKERIASWYKAYKLITVPFSMLSMGYCY